jgi:hypothetical protein
LPPISFSKVEKLDVVTARLSRGVLQSFWPCWLYAFPVSANPFPMTLRRTEPKPCITCAHFGYRWDRNNIWCERPGDHHVRSNPDHGCAFWMRETGLDEVPDLAALPIRPPGP